MLGPRCGKWSPCVALAERGWRAFGVRIIILLLAKSMLGLSPLGAGAVPQLGEAAFATNSPAGWSDQAFGAQLPGLLSEAELRDMRAALDTAEPAALTAAPPTLVAFNDGPLAGSIVELTMVGPAQGLYRWSVTCTPDPVTVCREAQQVRASAAAPPRPASILGVVPLAAIIGMVGGLAIALVLAGRGLVVRRRLASGHA